MPKIIIFVFIIQKVWEEEEKCYSGKLKMSRVNISQIKITSEETQITYMNNFYQLMHLILKFIQLVHIICMHKQEGLQHWMALLKEIKKERKNVFQLF
jgi:hypothetical protein